MLLSLAILLTHFLKKDRLLHFRFVKIDRKDIIEILTNIIKHVPPSKADADAAEIRVTIDGGDLILRIRDNTAAFNLSALAKLQQDTTDPSANLGLKLICKTAKDIRYYSTLGVNTAIIKV